MKSIQMAHLTGLFPVSVSQSDPLVVHDRFGEYLFDLYNAKSLGDASVVLRSGIVKSLVIAINQTWTSKTEPDEGDRKKFIEEQIAPLLRAGYNLACEDLALWCHSHKELNILDLYAKIKSMQETRREVITETLKKEYENH